MREQLLDSLPAELYEVVVDGLFRWIQCGIGLQTERLPGFLILMMSFSHLPVKMSLISSIQMARSDPVH